MVSEAGRPTPEDFDGETDQFKAGADTMARAVAMAFDSQSRFRERPGDTLDPYARLNSIMDKADERDKLLEECAGTALDLENLARRLVPCIKTSALLPTEMRAILSKLANRLNGIVEAGE